MRIIQVLPTLAFGDAVGNDTVALHRALAEKGVQTKIYTQYWSPQYEKAKFVEPLKKLPKLTAEDIMILHISTGFEFVKKLDKFPCKKIMMYHNVTPPEFFKPYDLRSYRSTQEGLETVKHLCDKVDYCFADSELNKQDLQEMGFQCAIDVLPILIPFDDYKKEPDHEIMEKYSDGKTNLVFTGRIAPNKKHEDIIQAFYYYKMIDPEARLFLVGNYSEEDYYYRRLKEYVRALDLEDVYFTGHISFSAILAYYRIADVFLCMSEHEGFCVPLVEAMWFDVPILAYQSTAIPYTLGGSGLMFDEKNYPAVAELIHQVVKKPELREKLIAGQRKRLEDFQHPVIERQFFDYLESFMGEKIG